MKIRLVVLAILGVALTLYLIHFVGLGAVLAAAVAVGWGGFALLCAYSLGTFLILGLAWWVLLPDRPGRGNLWLFVRARMVRDSAAEVLPFSQFGGMALGARAATLDGVPATVAVASMVVDVTTEMLAQIVFIALGLGLLIARAPHTAAAASMTRVFSIGLAVAAIAAGLFLALQRYGHQITARVASRLLPGGGAATAAATATLDVIYRSRGRVALSIALHLSAWIATAAGTFIAFRLIGVHVDLAAVIAIESLVYATRSAAVIVPNALGVQEAAYAVLAPLFGVGAQFGLAVSLIKRARDIAVGAPILILWQFVEGHRALTRGARIEAIDPEAIDPETIDR